MRINGFPSQQHRLAKELHFSKSANGILVQSPRYNLTLIKTAAVWQEQLTGSPFRFVNFSSICKQRSHTQINTHKHKQAHIYTYIHTHRRTHTNHTQKLTHKSNQNRKVFEHFIIRRNAEYFNNPNVTIVRWKDYLKREAWFSRLILDVFLVLLLLKVFLHVKQNEACLLEIFNSVNVQGYTSWGCGCFF